MGRFIFVSFGLLVMFLSLSGTEAGVCCPFGWSGYDQNCYKAFEELMTWADAEKFCTQQHKGSHLLSLHNIAEADFVVKTTVSGSKDGVIWMGLSDVWNECNWGWTDGAQLDYKAWNVASNCFIFKTAENNWSRTDCSGTHNFVCKSPA
uniref:Snaclec 6 n=1 Tax=Bitis arietans TaxID=8692 RepID=SL6_BITAR